MSVANSDIKKKAREAMEKKAKQTPVYVDKRGKSVRHMSLDSTMLVRYIYMDQLIPSAKNQRLLHGNFVVGGNVDRKKKEVTFKVRRVPIGIMLGCVENHQIQYSVAFCNPNDTFSRKRALQTVMGRYYTKYRLGRHRETALNWEDLCEETHEVNGRFHPIIPSRLTKGVFGRIVRKQVESFMFKLNQRAKGV